jgi:hypothetical protein
VIDFNDLPVVPVTICPFCGNRIDFDYDMCPVCDDRTEADLKVGDSFKCPECGKSVEVSGTNPLLLAEPQRANAGKTHPTSDSREEPHTKGE